MCIRDRAIAADPGDPDADQQQRPGVMTGLFAALEQYREQRERGGCAEHAEPGKSVPARHALDPNQPFAELLRALGQTRESWTLRRSGARVAGRAPQADHARIA